MKMLLPSKVYPFSLFLGLLLTYIVYITATLITALSRGENTYGGGQTQIIRNVIALGVVEIIVQMIKNWAMSIVTGT